jgi:protein O-GlcNAc transferase
MRALTLALIVWTLAAAPRAGAQGLLDDPAFALYREAVAAMDRKDHERARTLATEAIGHYPDHLLAHYLLGQLALAESRWEDAAASLTKVVALYPASFAGQRDLGIALQKLGRVDDAASAYEAALARVADSEDVRVRLVFMLLQAGQRDRALPDLQALAAQKTKVPEVWASLARVHYEQGDLAASEKAFTRAVELRDDGKSWFNLAVVRLRLDGDGALAAFERAAQHPDVREQAQREIEKLRAVKTPPTRGGDGSGKK